MAHGNPLEQNRTIKNFRTMFMKKIAEAGKAPHSAAPLCVEHIIEHGKHFMLKESVDVRDVMLHALMLVAMNTGMRYDEAAKLQMGLSKCTKHGIQLGLRERTKNSCTYREYRLR